MYFGVPQNINPQLIVLFAVRKAIYNRTAGPKQKKSARKAKKLDIESRNVGQHPEHNLWQSWTFYRQMLVKEEGKNQGRNVIARGQKPLQELWLLHL